jgi:hypothetical protein
MVQTWQGHLRHLRNEDNTFSKLFEVGHNYITVGRVYSELSFLLGLARGHIQSASTLYLYCTLFESSVHVTVNAKVSAKLEYGPSGSIARENSAQRSCIASLGHTQSEVRVTVLQP